jgi:hypothetical protein
MLKMYPLFLGRCLKDAIKYQTLGENNTMNFPSLGATFFLLEFPLALGIYGNVRAKQAYLLSFIIVVRSSIRPFLLPTTKLSMLMWQSTSNGCTFFIYGNQA